jgi:septum formation protein
VTYMMPRIYLASRSLRRRELLKQIGVPFQLLLIREAPPRGADVDESTHPGETPETYVRRMCHTKAAAAWQSIDQRRLQRLPVLTADTAVCLDGEILGKPADRVEATRMLSALSGREHRVLSAVAIQFDERVELAVNESFVRFRAMSAEEIGRYVETGEPMDKAGGYAIQGRAAVFAAELRGSHSAVMGLPLFETAMLLERFAEP